MNFMKVRSGTVLVVVLAAILFGGWRIYQSVIPPRWLHNFAADVALRAAPDPTAPPPQDIREATPHGLADHPYICLRNLVPFSWDRFVVVPSGADVRTVLDLRGVTWSDDTPEEYAPRMAKDPRYQLVVLLKDDQVVSDEPFFTFWADLSALARPGGFTPEDAIFTAVVKDGRYVLTPVAPPFPAACGQAPPPG